MVTHSKICSIDNYYSIFITVYSSIKKSNAATRVIRPQKCLTLFGTYIKDELLHSTFRHNLEAKNNLSSFKSSRIILITL
jgi:hypothetical protein